MATVVDELSGIEMFGGVVGDPEAAARLADDGGAAGVRPATAIACGVVCADGSAGSVE